MASSSAEARKRIRNNLKVNVQIKDDYDCTKNTSFPEKSDLDSNIPLFSEKFMGKRKVTETYKKLLEKFLGVYGIVPLSVIEYIKKNKLYLD